MTESGIATHGIRERRHAENTVAIAVRCHCGHGARCGVGAPGSGVTGTVLGKGTLTRTLDGCSGGDEFSRTVLGRGRETGTRTSAATLTPNRGSLRHLRHPGRAQLSIDAIEPWLRIARPGC